MLIREDRWGSVAFSYFPPCLCVLGGEDQYLAVQAFQRIFSISKNMRVPSRRGLMREIAEQLHMKRSHVATLIFRAKQELRQKLAERLGE